MGFAFRTTLCAALLGLGLMLSVGATSALGARAYQCEITGNSTPSPDECNGIGNDDPDEGGFGELYGIAVDNEDNLWINNPGHERIERYDSNGNYLAGSKITAPFAGYARSVAFDNAKNRAIIAHSGYNELLFFDSTATLTDTGLAIYGGCCFLFIGADNSGGPSDGYFYVESTGFEEEEEHFGEVYKFDKDGNPVSFTGSAPYLHTDACGTCTGTTVIRGTPSGPLQVPFFPQGGVAVNSAGNIFVSEAGRAVVDEFNPAGEFIREITETPDGGHLQSTSGIAVDPTNDHVIVADPVAHTLEEFDSSGNYLDTIEGNEVTEGQFFQPVGLAVDSTGRLYEADGGFGVEAQNSVHRFGPSFILPKVTYAPETELTRTGVTVHATVDPQAGSAAVGCEIEYGTSKTYGSGMPCSPDPASSPPGSHFTSPTPVLGSISGLSASTTYHYRITATNAEGTRLGKDRTFTTNPAVDNLTTLPASEFDDVHARLNGSFDGLGEENFYYFQWGTNTTYGGTTPETSSGAATGATGVHAEITGLSPITVYHFRVVVKNSTGTSYGADETFKSLPAFPVIEHWSSAVRSDTATLNASINPGGGLTTYHFEYGTSTGYGTSVPIQDEDIGEGLSFVQRSRTLLELTPGTTYHYRVLATNSRGTVQSADHTFHTFPFFEVLHDPCGNALIRKQTNAALLLDCRAYEIASAANSGGYDVRSDLVPGQTPLEGYPDAPSRLLYSVHYGAIPGTGKPTNYGPDPYVATRGEDGWSTRYVGIPADGTPSTGPFASRLLGADDSLSTFAFGGLNLCEPCFPDGTSGIPTRLSTGALVQEMTGSIPPGPGAQPEGYVGKPISGDGRHLVFGSTSKLEAGGNENGDITIYDRNLLLGTTHVVSKTPAGTTMTGPEIGELDISADGSRILLGRKVSVDADGNSYWHLYMNVADSAQTIDLTPGTVDGVLYDGMADDGTSVLFTSPESLLPGDTDNSPDIYRANVGTSTSTPIQVTPGNSDACNPVSSAIGPHWNVVGASADCGAVGISGGGGIATNDGTVYFLSPEVLASGAVADQPNVFVARPGAAPKLVVTLGPDNPLVQDSVSDNEIRNTADFEVTPAGDVAVFTSRLSPTGYDNDGKSEVYRYDEEEGETLCASCPLTNARATGDARLASHGLSLTDDGRVFFTTTEPLVLRDLNGKSDAYEWSEGQVAPLSSGSNPLDSGFFSVSADGVDAYFFTHETFVGQDANGDVMKIYDAREDGGFLSQLPLQPCQASDECHGPGSQEPPEPSIRTVTGSNQPQTTPRKRCPKGKTRKGRRCVKKAHHRRSSRHHG